MNSSDKIFLKALVKALVLGILFFIGFFCACLKANASDYHPRGSANAQAHARKGQKNMKHNHKIILRKK